MLCWIAGSIQQDEEELWFLISDTEITTAYSSDKWHAFVGDLKHFLNISKTKLLVANSAILYKSPALAKVKRCPRTVQGVGSNCETVGLVVLSEWDQIAPQSWSYVTPFIWASSLEHSVSRDFNSLKEQRIRSNYSQLLCTSLTDCNFVSAVQFFWAWLCCQNKITPHKIALWHFLWSAVLTNITRHPRWHQVQWPKSADDKLAAWEVFKKPPIGRQHNLFLCFS